MNNQTVYRLPNAAIHLARQQLEQPGILNPWARLEQLGDTAAEINVGVRSLSRLNLEQRRLLTERLIETGARVKNPDYLSERSGRPEMWRRPLESRKSSSAPSSARRPDYWKETALLRADPPPRNAREVTTLRIALESMLASQNK